jgi:hypothetical protein
MIHARVTAGRIAFGISAAGQKILPGEQSFNASSEAVEVVLPLPASAGLNLYIRNAAPNGTISKVALESIQAWQLEK